MSLAQGLPMATDPPPDPSSAPTAEIPTPPAPRQCMVNIRYLEGSTDVESFSNSTNAFIVHLEHHLREFQQILQANKVSFRVPSGSYPLLENIFYKAPSQPQPAPPPAATESLSLAGLRDEVRALASLVKKNMAPGGAKQQGTAPPKAPSYAQAAASAVPPPAPPAPRVTKASAPTAPRPSKTFPAQVVVMLDHDHQPTDWLKAFRRTSSPCA